jgi:protein-tyrosine-phosphatase/DNA-binding transcriptional ArsR family regulator
MYHARVPVSGGPVPPVVRLLADPVRWQLVRLLAGGDRRVRELVAATGAPQNLVSYHLRQLRTDGLVTARRSSFDARDTYYRLDLERCQQALAGALSALHPDLAPRLSPAPHPGPATHPGLGPHPAATAPPAARGARRVLFVCSGNSSRSPMAEALLRHRAAGRAEVASAGIRPKPLHPQAAAALRDGYRLDISGHQPTAVDAVAGQRFDYVISLCDKAREACPEFPAPPARLHWSMADPASDGRYAAFRRTAAELDTRIRYLLPVLAEAA